MAVIATTLTGLSFYLNYFSTSVGKILSLKIMKCLRHDQHIKNLKIKLMRKINFTWHKSGLQYHCQVKNTNPYESLVNTKHKKQLKSVGAQ